MRRFLPILKKYLSFWRRKTCLMQILQLSSGIVCVELPMHYHSAKWYHQHTLSQNLRFLGGVQLYGLKDQIRNSVKHFPWQIVLEMRILGSSVVLRWSRRRMHWTVTKLGNRNGIHWHAPSVHAFSYRLESECLAKEYIKRWNKWWFFQRILNGNNLLWN